MTLSGADLAVPLALATDASRLVLADLSGRLARGLMENAARYKPASRQATGALQQALERFGRETEAQSAEVASVARILGVAAPVNEPGLPASVSPEWGVILGEAFQAERAAGRLARELATLAPDPPLKALAVRLAARAAERADEVRKLYLRYS